MGLDGYGSDDGTFWEVGKNKIEIWLNGVKLYQQYFTLAVN